MPENNVAIPKDSPQYFIDFIEIIKLLESSKDNKIVRQIKEILNKQSKVMLDVITLKGLSTEAVCLSVVGAKAHLNRKMLVHYLAENKDLTITVIEEILQYIIEESYYAPDGERMAETLVNYPSFQFSSNSIIKDFALQPIHFAIRSNRIENVNLFLQYGADCELVGGVAGLKEFVAQEKNLSEEMKNYINGLIFTQHLKLSVPKGEYQVDDKIAKSLNDIKEKFKKQDEKQAKAKVDQDQAEKVSKFFKSFLVKKTHEDIVSEAKQVTTTSDSASSRKNQKSGKGKKASVKTTNPILSRFFSVASSSSAAAASSSSAAPASSKKNQEAGKDTLSYEEEKVFEKTFSSPIYDTSSLFPAASYRQSTSSILPAARIQNPELASPKRTARDASISEQTIHPGDKILAAILPNYVPSAEPVATEGGSKVNSPAKKKSRAKNYDAKSIPLNLNEDTTEEEMTDSDSKSSSSVSSMSSTPALAPVMAQFIPNLSLESAFSALPDTLFVTISSSAQAVAEKDEEMNGLPSLAYSPISPNLSSGSDSPILTGASTPLLSRAISSESISPISFEASVIPASSNVEHRSFSGFFSSTQAAASASFGSRTPSAALMAKRAASSAKKYSNSQVMDITQDEDKENRSSKQLIDLSQGEDKDKPGIWEKLASTCKRPSSSFAGRELQRSSSLQNSARQ